MAKKIKAPASQGLGEVGLAVKEICDRMQARIDEERQAMGEKAWAAKVREHQLQHERSQIRDRYSRSGIPPEARQITFDRAVWIPGSEHIKREIYDRLEPWEPEADGRGLLFTGDVGTGKTYLAFCIANRLIQEVGVDVYFTSFAELVDGLSNSAFWKERQALWQRVRNVRVLIVDDIARATGTGNQRTTWWVQKFWVIADWREKRKLPMITTANYKPQTLEKVLSKATMSRIANNADRYDFEGPNRRLPGGGSGQMNLA